MANKSSSCLKPHSLVGLPVASISIFNSIDTNFPLFLGVAAVGETYTSAFLLNKWAQDRTFNVSKRRKMDAMVDFFDFVFLIRLKDVKTDCSLEAVIAEQHSLSQEQEEHVRTLLDGSFQCNLLFCLDGYDEYKMGTNSDIDEVITNTKGQYFVLVTTRPGQYISKSVADKVNHQVQLKGFSDREIRSCAKDYLHTQEKADKLIDDMKGTGLYDLLKIPMILLMTLQLHEKLQTLPKSETEIIWKIIQMSMDRATSRHLGKKSSEVANLEEMLFCLGELSWSSLQEDTEKLVMNKVNENVLLCTFYPEFQICSETYGVATI